MIRFMACDRYLYSYSFDFWSVLECQNRVGLMSTVLLVVVEIINKILILPSLDRDSVVEMLAMFYIV